MIIKSTLKIGIKQLISCIGTEDNYKDCDSCELFNKITVFSDEEMKLAEHICSSCKKKYKNEKNNLKIENESLLSKGQLRVFLFLHLICNGNGYVKLKVKDLYNEINKGEELMTERCIRNALDKLKELGYILMLTNSPYCYISIRKYSEVFTDEYTAGYLELQASVLYKLMQIRNVQLFRIMLRIYLEASRKNMYNEASEVEDISVSYNKIKRWTKNRFAKSEIERSFIPLAKDFCIPDIIDESITVNRDKIDIVFLEEYDNYLLKKQLKNSFEEMFDLMMKKHNVVYDDNLAIFRKDVEQMSNEYWSESELFYDCVDRILDGYKHGLPLNASYVRNEFLDRLA